MAGVTSQLVADEMAAVDKSPAWTGPRVMLADALAAAVRPNDLVVTMGAGDVTHVGPLLLRALASSAS